MKSASLIDRYFGLSHAKRTAIAAVLIFVLALAAYVNSFDGEYHYDDIHQVVKNTGIRDPANIPRFFTSGRLGTYLMSMKGYRPFVYSSFAVNYAVSGECVWSYHLFNFLSHCLDALLVFILVYMVLGTAGRREASGTALFVSLAFALHPIQTSAVSYISGRAVPMMTFFYLAGFICFLRFRAASGGRSGAYICAAAAPVMYFMGLLTKETAVSLPAVMLVYDLVFTIRREDYKARKRGTWLYYLPFLAGLAVFIVIRRSVAGYLTLADKPYGGWEYLLSEARALLMYVRLLVFPVNQNFDYNMFPAESFGAWQAVAFAAVSIAAVALYRLRTRNPAVTFFGAWFLLTVTPESSVIPISDIAVEYRLYLPSIGFIAAMALLVSGYFKTRSYRYVPAVALLVFFGCLTLNRNAVMATEHGLWQDVVRKSPGSARAHLNLGIAFANEKRYKDAVSEFGLALTVEPRFLYRYDVLIYNNLGLSCQRMGRAADAEAWFMKALTRQPKYREANINLAMLYTDEGRYDDALGYLGRVLSIDPGNAPAHYRTAVVLSRMGRVADAQKEMELAYRYAPKDFDVNYDLAVIQGGNGDRDGAMEHARLAAGLAHDGMERERAERLLDWLQGPGAGAGEQGAAIR